MSELAVARLEKGAWTPALIEEMGRLVAPITGPDPSVLSDELLRGDRLYLARDAQGLAAFMLVARVRLPVGPECRHARYLGATAVRSDAWSSGAAAALQARVAADTQAEESRLRQRLLLFSTTATLGALCAARTLWADVQPAQDGSFNDELVPVAFAAAHWLGTRPEPRLPFVLQGLGAVRPRAWARCGCSAADHGRRDLDFLRRLGVDEATGDRLLLFCSLSAVRAPSAAEAA
ncbi:MAG TPA: hypothetical protein VMT11_01790 [Myxococcaceae bacterium]|nr:hypothetical protein [Myxococcaceae bacterium]